MDEVLYIGNDNLISINESNIYINRNHYLSEEKDPKDLRSRRLYIGDPGSHSARLKVYKSSSGNSNYISISNDLGVIDITIGNQKDIDMTNKEIEFFCKLYEDNYDLLYYAFDNRSKIDQDIINKAFIKDSNLRLSFDGKKEEGKLVNPNVIRDRKSGNVSYTIYKLNKFGYIQPTKIIEDINGNIISEQRAY